MTKGMGGILYIEDYADSTYTFDSCTFNNVSASSGGLIYDQSACKNNFLKVIKNSRMYSIKALNSYALLYSDTSACKI